MVTTLSVFVIKCVSYSQFEDESHFMLRLIDLTELDNVLMVELCQ